MNYTQKNIAIDFDGTIHNKASLIPPHRMGQPFPGTYESLCHFREIALRIVIFCVWADSEKNIETISKWMDYFNLPFDEITNVKPDAVAYIDNRAIRFENNWEEIINKYFS